MDDILNKLNAAFDKYDQKQADKKNSEDMKKSEHQTYLEHFKTLCNDIIKPAMEEIGEAIKSRGHKYSITQCEESKDDQGRTTCASIQIDILPDGKAIDRINLNNPHLSYNAGTYDNKTWSHVSTMMPGRGGSSGKGHEYKLDEITKATVQKEMVELITKCFVQ